MYGWKTAVAVLVFFALSASLEATANDRQFPANNENKPQSNPRAFGQANISQQAQGQTRKFGQEASGQSITPRTFGIAPQTASNRVVFPHSSEKVPHILVSTESVYTVDSGLPTEEPKVQLTSLISTGAVPKNNTTEVSFTESFLSDPGRVGGLVGGITAGAIFLNPLAPIIGNVLGYLVGKNSDYSERKKELIKQYSNERPIATSEGAVDVIRLNSN